MSLGKIVVIVLCSSIIITVIDFFRSVRPYTSTRSSSTIVWWIVWDLLVGIVTTAITSAASTSLLNLTTSWFITTHTVANASLGTVKPALLIYGEIFVLLQSNLEQLDVAMTYELLLPFSKCHLSVIAALKLDYRVAGELSVLVLANLDRIVFQSKSMEELHNLVLCHTVG